MFERSLELAAELGLVAGGTEQILDSTPMLGAAAVQDTVTLVRAGVRKLIDAVSAADKQAAGELRRGLRFDYAQPRVRPEGDWQVSGWPIGRATAHWRSTWRWRRAILRRCQPASNIPSPLV